MTAWTETTTIQKSHPKFDFPLDLPLKEVHRKSSSGSWCLSKFQLLAKKWLMICTQYFQSTFWWIHQWTIIIIRYWIITNPWLIFTVLKRLLFLKYLKVLLTKYFVLLLPRNHNRILPCILRLRNQSYQCQINNFIILYVLY